MSTDERTLKRVRITEVRGERRQGGDVEGLDVGAAAQHFDADVEVRAHKTHRVEDVVGDAATSEQMQMEERPMNRLVCSKTEVLDNIGESLSQ